MARAKSMRRRLELRRLHFCSRMQLAATFGNRRRHRRVRKCLIY